MLSMTRKQAMTGETTAVSWSNLYTVGGSAALVIIALIVAGVVTFVVWPPPPPEATVTDWFALFQRNWLVGMLKLDLGMLLSYVALIPLLLALSVALWRTNPTLMALAATFGLVGITTYFAASRLFEMLALSQQYAVATTEAQRASLVAAGQSMLTTYLGYFAAPAPFGAWSYQGTAFNISYILWSVAGVLLAVTMLRNASFGKRMGYVGIGGNLAALGIFAPIIGVYLSLAGLVIQLVWYSLIAQALFRLATEVGGATGVYQASPVDRPTSVATR